MHTVFGGGLISPSLKQEPLPSVIDDLMTVHIRRGDYKDHCEYLEKWTIPYMGWNQLPGLGDAFVPPIHSKVGANLDVYLKHCWPRIEQIVERVEAVRTEWEKEAETREGQMKSKLRRLYVLTNGDVAWLEELKAKLRELDSWDVVLTSRDISLTFEQKYVAQAVDMAIAERAAVFIGNGVSFITFCFLSVSISPGELFWQFSSMSANVVLMRSIHKLPLISNHFW